MNEKKLYIIKEDYDTNFAYLSEEQIKAIELICDIYGYAVDMEAVDEVEIVEGFEKENEK